MSTTSTIPTAGLHRSHVGVPLDAPTKKIADERTRPAAPCGPNRLFIAVFGASAALVATACAGPGDEPQICPALAVVCPDDAEPVDADGDGCELECPSEQPPVDDSGAEGEGEDVQDPLCATAEGGLFSQPPPCDSYDTLVVNAGTFYVCEDGCYCDGDCPPCPCGFTCGDVTMPSGDITYGCGPR